MQNLRDMWRAQYQVVPQQLAKVAEVRNLTTAFNTNIDAVIKLSGAKISELADGNASCFIVEFKLFCSVDSIRHGLSIREMLSLCGGRHSFPQAAESPRAEA